MPRPVLAQVDSAFRAASLRPRAPPTRLLLNLTERCQLRCAHCITHAPWLTATGAARVMADEVLDALAPHLGPVHWVGLTHAGEPTLAPGLVPFLMRLRAARRGAPTVVHVVSNGMALEERRFLDLVRAGVSSFGFSLDGATAQTNDALRVGAKVVVLERRLREFTSLRRAERLDVRLGVSCTVTRSNVHEVPAVARLVARAGVDWLKLEETFPNNPRAVDEARVPPKAVRGAVKEAARVCAEAGLRLVDHTVAREVWRCRPAVMGVEDAAFAAADDFANRVELNPCRAPWELVCVEPNGDVKPQDFHQPAAGNLLHRDLLSLWRSAPFAGRRERSAAHRRCEGAPSCAADPGPGGW